MVRENELRPGELAVDVPTPDAAGLVYIGTIRTPWTSRLECPRQGRLDGPLCRLEIHEPWIPALQGIEQFARLELLYWLDRSRRDIVLQSPKSDGRVRGAFSLRSPVRPNPIATQIVTLVGLEGATVLVRGMDCLDGTPLLDIKPDRTLFHPLAPAQPGDFQVGDVQAGDAPCPRTVPAGD